MTSKHSTEQSILDVTETDIVQIGVIVNNLDRTLNALTALGLGPFSSPQTVKHPCARVQGKQASYAINLACAQQGAVQLELIEYHSGTTIQKDFLDQQGEGLHHILFQVKDIDNSMKKMTDRGLRILQQDYFVGGGGMAYLEGDDLGGIVIELVQYPEVIDPEIGLRYQSR